MIPPVFWRPCPIGPARDARVYREVIIVCTRDLLDKVKYYRSPSWAILPILLNEEYESPPDAAAQTLTVVVESGDSDGAYRYDRVVIIDSDPQRMQCVKRVLQECVPRVIHEKRVFWARLLPVKPEHIEAEIHRAIGAAVPVEHEGSE